MDDVHATLKEQVLVCIDSSELFIYSLLVARKLHVGNATYFAENFSKADLHAGPYCFKRFKGHCHVLVVAVLMGRVSVERSRLRQALRIDSKCFKDSS